ncbi:MAG: N-glycosylase/DNA lyase [Candidatus Asgardarchaeia archaeon]
MINLERVRAIADAFANLGFEGISKFDKTEPEFKILTRLAKKEDESTLYAISICAGLVDYQLLKGGAERLWSTLYDVYTQFGKIDANENRLYNLFETFLKQPINARLREQKLNRLKKLFDSGLIANMLKNPERYIQEPQTTWITIARILNNPPYAKTVVFSMKVLDLAHYVLKNRYLNFPSNIPIPLDLHVKAVAVYSGIVTFGATNAEIKKAWIQVLYEVNKKITPKTNLLRLDSVIWQAGKIISKSKGLKKYAIKTLSNYFTTNVGIPRDLAEKLSNELTFAMTSDLDFHKIYDIYKGC